MLIHSDFFSICILHFMFHTPDTRVISNVQVCRCVACLISPAGLLSKLMDRFVQIDIL